MVLIKREQSETLGVCRHLGDSKIKASKPKATVVHVDIKWLFYSQVDEGALMCFHLRIRKTQSASGQKIQISSTMGELCCPRFMSGFNRSVFDRDCIWRQGICRGN